MKTIRVAAVAFFFCLFAVSFSHAGILGDVNNDGKIGFPEAINALQVLSGAQTTLPASFVIRWRGEWESGKPYQEVRRRPLWRVELHRPYHPPVVHHKPSLKPVGVEPDGRKGITRASGVAEPEHQHG